MVGHMTVMNLDKLEVWVRAKDFGFNHLHNTHAT
jgi:hypothetical protein